jgi:hypothetical protein
MVCISEKTERRPYLVLVAYAVARVDLDCNLTGLRRA